MSLFFCLIERPACPPIDLGLILDSSGSLNFGDNEEKIQEFAKALVDKFDIGEDGTHVSIVQFDDDPTVLLGFNDPQTRSNVRNNIDSYKISVGGQTFLNKAIDKTDEEFELGMRGSDFLKVRIPSNLQICTCRLREIPSVQTFVDLNLRVTTLYCKHANLCPDSFLASSLPYRVAKRVGNSN